MIESQLNIFPGRCAKRRPATAFTLVELLVVIGIIALLIGILLPSLIAARESSKRAACGSQLHQIMLAATIHATEHKGFYPLAGQLNTTAGDPSTHLDPPDLNDTYNEHYTYMSISSGATAVPLIAPITFALGTEMGFKRNLDATTDGVQLVADLDNIGVIRNFICPSHVATPIDIQKLGWLYEGNAAKFGPTGYTEAMSYIFNEYVVGYDDLFGRLRGQASRVKQSSKTMFAMDGLVGPTTSRLSGTFVSINGQPPQYAPAPYGTMTIWNSIGSPNQFYSPISLGDALVGTMGPRGKSLAGDPANFDQIRHKGKMNVAFCDGHVELRDIPPFTLSGVGGTKAIMRNDPTASGLQNIYIVPP